MSPARETEIFLNMIAPEVRAQILMNIADHYGIDEDEAFEEVTDPDAERLLDYVTGYMRESTALLMKKYRIH